MTEPIHVTSLLRYEFANAIRLAAFRRTIPQQTALSALAAFDADLTNGIVVLTPCVWETVHREAERLSHAHTFTVGHRSLDILHVATALTLGAREFLTFDARQHALAQASGLRVNRERPSKPKRQQKGRATVRRTRRGVLLGDLRQEGPTGNVWDRMPRRVTALSCAQKRVMGSRPPANTF